MLTEEHELFSEPRVGENACYRRGEIFLRGFARVTWNATGVLPSEDASGEFDYDNFHKFEHVENCWIMVGDWGEIEVTGGALDIKFIE